MTLTTSPVSSATLVSAAYKATQKWGYLRAAGQLRVIKWDDMLADKYDLGGSTTGWGLNFSSSLNLGKNDVLRLSLVYGKGIQNYMQDSPVDVGIAKNPGNAVTPVVGKPLPILRRCACHGCRVSAVCSPMPRIHARERPQGKKATPWPSCPACLRTCTRSRARRSSAAR